MKHLILIFLLAACAKNQPTGATLAPGLPLTPGVCKGLKALWTSTTDSEVHDWRNLDFTYQFKPYSYVGTNGANCNQQMKWFMFTPEINGSSFEFDLQNSPGAGCKRWHFLY
jgi:hypothetical protein